MFRLLRAFALGVLLLPGAAQADAPLPVDISRLDEPQREQVAMRMLKAWTELLAQHSWIRSANEECQRIRPDDAARIEAAFNAYHDRNVDVLENSRAIMQAGLTELSENTGDEIAAWIDDFETDGLERARTALLGELARYGADGDTPVQNYCRNSVDMMKDPRFALSRDSAEYQFLLRFEHLRE